MRRITLMLALLTVVQLAISATPAHAAIDAYLKISGIETTTCSLPTGTTTCPPIAPTSMTFSGDTGACIGPECPTTPATIDITTAFSRAGAGPRCEARTLNGTLTLQLPTDAMGPVAVSVTGQLRDATPSRSAAPSPPTRRSRRPRPLT